jgi:hypothetical protein
MSQVPEEIPELKEESSLAEPRAESEFENLSGPDDQTTGAGS